MTDQIPATRRLYLEDGYAFEVEAIITSVNGKELSFERTCFFPGGGGQPPDSGAFNLTGGEKYEISSAFTREDGVICHITANVLPSTIIGQKAHLMLDGDRRMRLMRAHTALHVLNTIALRDYGAWITGVQIGVEHSRIDFKLEDFSAALAGELEKKVNSVLSERHDIRTFFISEEEFRARPDLQRTLTVSPPISEGRIRVVEIEGFDAQACGGTHVHSTSEVGRLTIFRTENKGRINKRIYCSFEPPG